MRKRRQMAVLGVGWVGLALLAVGCGGSSDEGLVEQQGSGTSSLPADTPVSTSTSEPEESAGLQVTSTTVAEPSVVELGTATDAARQLMDGYLTGVAYRGHVPNRPLEGEGFEQWRVLADLVLVPQEDGSVYMDAFVGLGVEDQCEQVPFEDQAAVLEAIGIEVDRNWCEGGGLQLSFEGFYGLAGASSTFEQTVLVQRFVDGEPQGPESVDIELLVELGNPRIEVAAIIGPLRVSWRADPENPRQWMLAPTGATFDRLWDGAGLPYGTTGTEVTRIAEDGTPEWTTSVGVRINEVIGTLSHLVVLAGGAADHFPYYEPLQLTVLDTSSGEQLAQTDLPLGAFLWSLAGDGVAAMLDLSGALQLKYLGLATLAEQWSVDVGPTDRLTGVGEDIWLSSHGVGGSARSIADGSPSTFQPPIGTAGVERIDDDSYALLEGDTTDVITAAGDLLVHLDPQLREVLPVGGSTDVWIADAARTGPLWWLLVRASGPGGQFGWVVKFDEAGTMVDAFSVGGGSGLITANRAVWANGTPVSVASATVPEDPFELRQGPPEFTFEPDDIVAHHERGVWALLEGGELAVIELRDEQYPVPGR